MTRMRRAGLMLSLTLPTCSVHAEDLIAVFQDALQADPQIRQAEANRRAAREARPQALASLLPQLGGTAGETRDHGSGNVPQFITGPAGQLLIVQTPQTTDTTTRSWGLNLRQSVFSFSNWMQLKAADSQAAQAEANYRAAEEGLIQRVAQAYFNVLAAIDNLEAQQASLEAIARQLDQANRRFEVGLIAITDVEEAKAAHDTAAAAVIAAKRTLATSEDQLQEVTGKKYTSLAKPGADMPLQTPEPADEGRWVQTSLEQNLGLIASRLAAEIARDNVQIARGGHLPTIDLLASRSYTNSNTDEVLEGIPFNHAVNRMNDRQYSLQVTVPLFSGGYTQSRVRQTQYQWIAAKEAVVQSSRATERQARDAYLGVISGIARVHALRQAVESSQVALKATEAGYEVGTRTAVDVLNARRSLVQAQTDYSGSRYDYIVSLVALRLAAGTLERAQLDEINAWLKQPASTSPPLTTPESLIPPPGAVTPQVPITPGSVTPPPADQYPPGRQPRP